MKENIEEDLKKTENLIECFRKAEIVNLECKESMYQRCNYSHYKAIEHILSDYKRVLKENEDWQKAYQEEKDKQFDLLRENQKLQKENEELKKLLNGNLYENYKYYKNLAGEYQGNCISKQKVKDEIEYINKFEEDLYKKENIIQVLQDLLEEKGE